MSAIRRKIGPCPGKILKKFCSGQQANCFACVRTRKTERCFCLSAKRERQKPRVRPAGKSRQGFYRKVSPCPGIFLPKIFSFVVLGSFGYLGLRPFTVYSPSFVPRTKPFSFERYIAICVAVPRTRSDYASAALILKI